MKIHPSTISKSNRRQHFPVFDMDAQLWMVKHFLEVGENDYSNFIRPALIETCNSYVAQLSNIEEFTIPQLCLACNAAFFLPQARVLTINLKGKTLPRICLCCVRKIDRHYTTLWRL